ncbi:MAG: bifunctional UDP-2,4-diacetamido-2,4,6-trideoxy-beta-L-altropyranose hydrolase/GNAT family N-acetyltransferase [Propionicimonas sp.]|nr:bifunctional UDP-2,4-diacetamido-2,4,6-trideoxy-beta-L-altropyranose hydrolase/GNAT family N-acetyltransferase [Propionicimonas sp.]
MTGAPAARRVLAHCNAGHDFGLGHLMRTLAVLEEALARGWEARILGDLDAAALTRVRRSLPAATVTGVPLDRVAGTLAGLVADWRPDVLHLDSYWLPADAVPAAAHLVSNVQDAPFGERVADLLVDPNLGAEERLARPGLGRHHLLGREAAIVRSEVRRRAGDRSPAGVASVLVVLGGTDPHGLTTRVVAALGHLDADLRLTVVAPPAQRPGLEALAAGSPRRIELIPLADDLPGLAAHHDLVVSAAGTSVWDFAHQGVPLAILAVTENQRAGYLAATAAGIAHGLGLPPHADLDERIAELGRTIVEPGALGRSVSAGRALIDGLGTWRIVGAWEQLLAAGEGSGRPAPDLAARPADSEDAAVLLEWRNDPVTRASSRSTDPIGWAGHVDWLGRVLADPDRHLFVLEDAAGPIASVRWDRIDARDWEVSITLAPQARGRGLAAAVLSTAERALPEPGPTHLLATVHRSNTASLRLFARCGSLPHLPADDAGFLTFARWHW